MLASYQINHFYGMVRVPSFETQQTVCTNICNCPCNHVHCSIHIHIYMGSGRFPGPMELLLQQLVRVSKTR